jgi:cobalt/nickel transport system permease protein
LRQRRIEDWSGGSSPLHRLHATAKLVILLTFLIAVSTMRRPAGWFTAAGFILIAATAAAAGIPVLRLFSRAAVVLPFVLCFAALSVMSQGAGMAALFVVRSYLSACAALLLVATTPMPRLIEGLTVLRLPRFLLQVMQFLYRYLAVLMSEAGAMRTAAQCRAGRLTQPGFRRAAAITGVLFARAWNRAEAVHRSMTARGFTGHLPVAGARAFVAADLGLAAAVCVGIIGLRLVLI